MFDPATERGAGEAAYWLVRAYYLFAFYIAFWTFRDLYRIGRGDREVEPLWPVFWVDAFPLEGVATSLGFGFVIACVTALAWPDRRWPKIAVAVFYLEALALQNSFGSIHHYGHVGLWIALCFAALPVASREALARSRALRQRYLTVFFTTQCLVALFYTLSGARKAFYGVFVPEGAVSSFAPDALPLMVVQRWLQTAEDPLLAGIFLENLWLGWPAHLAVIYIETFALVAIFRPELHRVWGLALMSFHILVWLLMGIVFAHQPMLVALLFFCSPFAPRALAPRQILLQLPLFGDLWSLVARRAGRRASGRAVPVGRL